MRGERFTDEFPFSPERDADSIRVMPGFEFKPRALLNGSAFVGFRTFTPKDPTAFPEFTGLVANLGLSYTLLGATTFGVSYARDVNYSFEPLQPYFLSDSVGASVRHALGRRFDVQVSTGRAVYAYRDLRGGAPVAGAPPPLDDREDTTWNYAASLGYRPGPADPRRLRRLLLGARVHDRLVPRLRRPPHRDVGYLRVLVCRAPRYSTILRSFEQEVRRSELCFKSNS